MLDCHLCTVFLSHHASAKALVPDFSGSSTQENFVKHLSYMSLSVINDDPNTLDAICKALSAINGVRYEYSGYAGLLDRDETKFMNEELVVYVPGDDSLPLVLVSRFGEIEGRALAPQEVTALRERSVCYAMRAKYPRTDRYGAPGYAASDDAAAVFAGAYFNVVEPFSYNGEDTRCDDLESVWLFLKATPVATCSQPATVSYPCGSLGEEV